MTFKCSKCKRISRPGVSQLKNFKYKKILNQETKNFDKQIESEKVVCSGHHVMGEKK